MILGLLLAFFAGIITKTFLSVYRFGIKRAVFSILVAISFGLFIGFYSFAKLEGDGGNIHIAIGLVFYAVAIVGSYKKKMLNFVNENSLILYTGLTLYLSINSAGEVLAINVFLMLLLFFLLFISITKLRLGGKVQVALMVYFLILNISIGLMLLGSRDFSLLCEGCGVERITLMRQFIYGVASFQILINIAYIYLLIPIPSRYTPYRQTINESKEYAKILDDNYVDVVTELPHLKIILTLVMLTLINYFLEIMPFYVWVSLAISIDAIYINSQKNYYKSINKN